MTITNPNAFLSDTSAWIHATFMVSMSESYNTYEAAMRAVLQDETFGTVGNPQLDAASQQLLNNISDASNSGLSPVYFSKRKCRDTSLGGNDAINPYYQYNENDDVMHPFHTTEINGAIGMGRVYSETIDDLQRILYLGFGTPKFNNLTGFFTRAYDADLGKLMNSGPDGMNIAQIAGELTGYAARAIISIPRLPMTLLRLIGLGAEQTPVTKYYDFRSQMPLYYRFVNTILIQLGVNLGIMDTSEVSASSTTTGSAISAASYSETVASINKEIGSQAGLPDYIKDYNFDFIKIALKRAAYEKAGTRTPDNTSTDQALRAQSQGTDDTETTAAPSSAETSPVGGTGSVSWLRTELNAFFSAYKDSLNDAFMFVGFKVERGASSSESLSTSTTQSPIQQTLNSKVQSARNINFSLMGGNIGSGMIASAIQGLLGVAGDFATGFSSSFGVSGLAALATGAAMFDIPEVWQDSNFSKSYSFNLQLKAPYGDPYTIMQSLYVPLACILAGALPRATGGSSYTSPFLCQAYCKGMVSIPLGIIDSLSINRGSDNHGWNAMGLPLSLDISLSIKDLSPSMYVAMSGNNLIQAAKDVVEANSPFNQYLMTLSGMGPLEWLSPINNITRRMKILHQVIPENIFNPWYLGMAYGQHSPIRYIYNFLPKTELLPK